MRYAQRQVFKELSRYPRNFYQRTNQMASARQLSAMINFSIQNAEKEAYLKEILRQQIEAQWHRQLHGVPGEYGRNVSVEDAVQGSSEAVQVDFWSLSMAEQE